MTDTCPKCGRPKITVTTHTLMQDVWENCDGSYLCNAAAYAYQSGRRDGIDEGVRIAKEHSTLADMSERRLCSGDYDPFIDWSKVDAEAEKAKEQTR